MAHTVTVDDVRKVAHLARIELSRDELQLLSGQVAEILDYVQQLQRIPTDRVEPTSHVLPLSNITRPDEQRPSLAPDEVLAIAPARHHQFYKVPKVVDATAG